MRKFLLILAFLLPSVACAGGLTLEKYESLLDRRETEIYLTGAYFGIMWSNVELVKTDKTVLYCPPEWLGESPRKILDAYLDEARDKHLDDDPIIALMLAALKKKFPCYVGPPYFHPFL